MENGEIKKTLRSLRFEIRSYALEVGNLAQGLDDMQNTMRELISILKDVLNSLDMIRNIPWVEMRKFNHSIFLKLNKLEELINKNGR